MCFVHRESCHKEKEATSEKCDNVTWTAIELMTSHNLQQVSCVVGVVGGGLKS